MADTQDKRDEKIGRAIATIIAGIVIFFLGKPLWIAPVVAIILFIIYRLTWRLIWKFIEWAGRQ